MNLQIILKAIVFLVLFAPNVISQDKNETRLLVSTTWLKDNLSEPALFICHIGTRQGFRRGHIPGAGFLSLRDLMLMENADGLLHEFPPPEEIKPHLENIGLTDSSIIILYYEDERFIPSAARIFLTLEVSGVGKSLAILNGGLMQWQSDNNKLSTEDAITTGTDLKFHPDSSMLVDIKWMRNNYNSQNVILIDGRPEDHYLGHSNPHGFPREGHITGAFNIPFYDLVNEEKPYLFRDTEYLKAMFSAIGVTDASLVVLYCNTGFWAPQVYFIAKYLGYDVRFYDASFQEWSAHEDLPVIGSAGIGPY